MTIGSAFLARAASITQFVPVTARPIPFRLGADDTYSTAVKKFGTASIYVGADTASSVGAGESQGLGNAVVSEPTTLLNLGTGDFTIECWVYPEDISDSSDRFVLTAEVTEKLQLRPSIAWSVSIMEPAAGGGIRFSTVGGNYETSDITVQHTGANVTVNTWNHIAVSRTSGNLTSYVNGTLAGFSSGFTSNVHVDSGFLASNSVLRPYPSLIVPTYVSGGIDGYIDEIRISSTGRYTTTFTPATAEFGSDANTVFLWHCNGVTEDDTVAPLVTVSGGTVSESGGYRYHTFNSSDATGLSVSDGSVLVEYILVAGGGAGGGATSGDAGHGGGGGAGGVITGTTTLTPGNYPVVIGAGGTAGANTYPASRFGNPSAWSLKSATAPMTIHLLNGYRRQPVAAANGQGVWLSSASPNVWQSYQNLPAYLLGLPCTVEIELSNTTQFSTNKSTKVYLMRDPTWGNGVDLTGWTLVESARSYLTGLTNLSVYHKTFAAGTHTIDSLSGVYFFEDTAATTSEYVYSRGGGYGGGYSTNSNGIQARGGSGGSGGGSSQRGSWHTTYTTQLTGDFGSVGIAGQGNTGGWQYIDNRTLCDPACNNQNYTPVSGTGGGGAGGRAAANALTSWTRQFTDGLYYPEVGVKGGGGGVGIQWLNGNYYGGGGGGATTSGWYIGETRTGLATYTDGVLQQPGGLGGGGDGRYNFSNTVKVFCTAGTANTGGGGGGAGPSTVDGTGGGAGGSGVLIVRYPI